MRVVCDNCGASYKIPESKLVKEVNKATCRKCGNAILIRRVTAPAKAAPTEGASPDERTQITSAADLERQARSRTGGYEENAAPAHAEAPHGEETVPRDDGPPQRRPAGASTDPGGAAAVPKPIPPMAPPKAPPARPPAAPVAALASPTPTPAPLRPPTLRDGPLLNEERPAPIPPPVSALPPAQPAGAGKGDLLLTLAGVVVGFFGAAAVVAGAVLNTPVLGLVGVFLLLFCLMFMLILLVSGGFGQRPASKLGATAGGLFAGSLGAIAWFALWGFGALTPGEPVAETPPSLKVEPTQVAVAEPPPAAPPVEAPIAAPVPEPIPEPVPEPVPEPAATPTPKTPEDPAAKARAEEEARLKAEAKAEAKAKAEADAKAKAEAKAAAKAEADAQARITPTPKPEPVPTPTTSKTTTTSSGSSLSVQAVATMVNSNKSVKLCYLKEANRTGAVPHAKVKVTVTPTGKATKALAVGEHAGTEFGNCLSGAITSITFPPFEGETTTITYAN